MKFKNYIETESGIKDTSTSPGTAGQVLSSTVTGTSWITPTSGNVSGTGTTNNMTKWSNTTGGLADALMTDNGSTVTLSTNGSANTFNLSHTSGSGIALNITKGGSGEALVLNKTSGSGNVLSVTGDSYFNGDVGIGTTSPNSKLQVDGEIDANGGDGYRINGKPWAAESSNNLRLGDWDGEGFTTTIYDDYSSPVVLVGEGKVGIGATGNPSTTLEVSSSGVNGVDISQSASNASQSGRLFFTTNTASEGFALFNSNGTFQVNSGGIPNNTSGTNRISIIGSSGNVGIGTTSPAKKLTIGGIGIGNTDGLKIEDPSNTAYGAHFSFDDGSTTVEIGGVTNNTLNDCISIARDATRTITIDTSERVGIGTTSPSKKLDVNGSLGCTSFEMGNLKMFTAFGGIFINGTTSGNTIFYGAPASFTQNLQVSGTVTCVNLVQTSQTDKKKDISNIDKSKAKTIQFKEYKYKEGDGDRKRYGVLVEDLENDYPELVHVGADGVKGINYIDLLVKRVAELEKELEDISLTPGPKGDTGATGATGAAGAAGTNGSNGKNGADGNSHLSNVTSIAFNPKANRLEVNIGGTVYNFAPSK